MTDFSKELTNSEKPKIWVYNVNFEIDGMKEAIFRGKLEFIFS